MQLNFIQQGKLTQNAFVESLNGTFKELWLSERAKGYIIEQHIQVKPGDKVRKFSG